jgi:hypothetical protein
METNTTPIFKAILERDYTYSNGIKFIEQCPVRIEHRVVFSKFFLMTKNSRSIERSLLRL